ncbi:chlorohydrolase family protein [Rhizobium sp. RAF56]|uniref:chlorohydrolase family protein n=1 Tax=Rhizobium sp. RAF56 TaxID=3233062 RepID=UPI003F962E6F
MTQQDGKHTLIRARWLVGFQDGEHRLIEDGVVVVQGDRIVHVGKEWEGEPDETIDARDCLAIPGLISTHAHVAAQVTDRLVLDGGRRDFMRSGFLNCAPRKLLGGPSLGSYEDADASIAYAFASLLRHGVTTIVEAGNTGDVGDIMLQHMGACGARLYYSPAFVTGEYFVDSDGRLVVHRDEQLGFDGLERAIRFIEDHDGEFGDRYRGILNPDEFYLSTPELRRRTREAADRLGVGITMHFCEQLFEFHETVRLAGRTPVQVLADEGFLAPDVLLGHCIYIAGHPMVAYPWEGDLELIAGAGATVAHAPLALARRGVFLSTFDRYQRAGVNIGIGTDSYPYDVIAEMRMASLAGKLIGMDNEAAKARDVFNAATLGGAKALGRDDLGRLAPGAKADIVLVNFDNVAIGPVWDPIRSLVMCASGNDVRTVLVGGKIVVDQGRVLFADEHELLRKAQISCETVWKEFPGTHWIGRPLADVFPPALRPWQAAPTVLS